MLFYAGEIHNWKGQTYFFLQVGETCKSRQSCSSTVPLPVKHIHQRICGSFTLAIVGGWTQKHSLAIMRYSNNFVHHVQNYRQTPHGCCCGLLTAKTPWLLKLLGRAGSSEVTLQPSDTLGREFDPGKRDFSH